MGPTRLPEPSVPGPAAMTAPADLATALSGTMAAIHRRGWCDGTGGNFSCVRRREPLELLMAPSGVDKGSVQPHELIVVDASGTVIEGKGKASAETRLHLEIVRRTGAGAVLHTHSPSATLLSRLALRHAGGPGFATVRLEGLEMLKGLEGVLTHQAEVRLPVLANDQNLERLSRLASPHLPAAPHGLLIGGHGLYAWGRDLDGARRHLEILEFLLEQRWRELLLLRPETGGGAWREIFPAEAPASGSPPVPGSPLAGPAALRFDVSHILLDIEGTTCPVSFVADTLFPYARERMEAFLLQHGASEPVATLLLDVEAFSAAHRLDGGVVDPGGGSEAAPERLSRLATVLRKLIEQDRKLPALKELQGLIWEHGYAIGELKAPLYPDVAPALADWSVQGFTLAVYSSGSVKAQQLLYRHSDAGDLRGLFRGWFDTRTGPKQEPRSYHAIAGQLEVAPSHILFLSDSLAELQAASQAGLQVAFSDRPGNPQREPGSFARFSALSELQLRDHQPASQARDVAAAVTP